MSPEPRTGTDVPRRRRSVWEVVGWIVVVVIVLGVLGFVGLVLSVRSAFPPMASLFRPQGLVAGSLHLDPSTASETIAVRLEVSPRAVAAAATGDGLVHLELDVAGVGDSPLRTQMGVRWRDPPEDVRPLGPLDAGADVRWTLACTTDRACERTMELTFAPAVGQPDALEVQWRLVAVVRPPRGTEVPADAAVTLMLVDQGQ